MKITLCCLNAKYIHASLAPWYLSAALAHCPQCEVTLVEGTINQPVEEVVANILQKPLETVAFSCYIWNIERVRQVVQRIKQRCPQAVIVLGGPEVSFRPKEILRRWPEVSYVLCGEGEESLPALLCALESAQGLETVAGLAWRTPEGRVACTPARPLQTQPPDPYSPAYLASLRGRIAYLETSRGCPFSCSFCLSGQTEPVRFFDRAESERRLLLLANSGAKTVKFIDRTFNCHPQRTYDWIAFLLRQYGKGYPKDVCFHFEVGADLFDERTLALLSAAPPGLIQMEAGLQSFCARTLEAVDRKTDLTKLTRNLRALIEPHNIHLHIDLIAGLPYEDHDTFADSFNQAFALRPQMLQLGFLKLLHGSKLRRQAETRGEWGYRFDQKAPYEVEKNRWISAAQLNRLHEAEDALERLYNSGRFLLTLEYLLGATGWDAFTLFETFGAYAAGQGAGAGVPLDTYTEWLWRFFAEQPGVVPQRLRDVMVVDRLSCDNTGRIPPLLRVEDKRLKLARGEARRRCAVKGKLGVALLYEPLRIAAFDYTERDPLTGRYAVRYFPFEA